MIVPIIFSLNPVAKNQMFTWTFIKAVSFAKGYHWPVIAQEQYFKNTCEMKGFFSDNLLEHFEYEVLSEDDFNKIIPVVIPKNIEKSYISGFPSQTDAYISSCREPWPEMEKFLEEEIERIEQEKNEKIEALITLPNGMFLENISKKLNIPLLHFEWGPFRPKPYRKTAYLDFENIVKGLKPRYERFIEEGVVKRVPIFSRNELLALFLEKDYLRYAIDEDKIPTYELGIASGYTTIGEYSAYNMVSLAEVHAKSLEHFNENDICWRFHPEDPMHSKIDAKNLSKHESGIEFILDCKRVLSLSSNMIFEAMLYNRLGYDLGFSHYSFQGNSNLDEMEDNETDIEFLNYVAFGYLIPYEFLNSVDYLRFRLGRPSEEEIYNYNLEYYLNVMKISKEVLKMEGKERLESILKVRGYTEVTDQMKDYSEHNIWFDSSEYAQNYIKIERLKNRNNELQKQSIKLIEQVKQAKQDNMILAEKNVALLSVLDTVSNVKRNLILLQETKSWKKSKIIRDIYQCFEKDNIDQELESNIHKISMAISDVQSMKIAVLYLDYGEGYNEDSKLIEPYSIIDGIHTVNFSVPDGVRAIRYDPCECGEKAIYFSELRINGEFARYSEFNIKKIGDKKTFLLKNPFFVLDTNEKVITISIKVENL